MSGAQPDGRAWTAGQAVDGIEWLVEKAPNLTGWQIVAAVRVLIRSYRDDGMTRDAARCTPDEEQP